MLVTAVIGMVMNRCMRPLNERQDRLELMFTFTSFRVSYIHFSSLLVPSTLDWDDKCTNLTPVPLVSVLAGNANGGKSMIGGDSSADGDLSWNGATMAINGGLVGASASTAFMRLHEEPSEKSLNGANPTMACIYSSRWNVTSDFGNQTKMILWLFRKHLPFPSPY